MGNTQARLPEEAQSVLNARHFLQEIQTNLRDKLEISPEDKQREINSFKGSFGHHHIESTVKSNFAFSAEILKEHKTEIQTLQLKSRHQKPIFEFVLQQKTYFHGGGRYYFSKSKLGLETMVYGSKDQLNCFFSRVTFKRLIAAVSEDTYAIHGEPVSAKLVPLSKFHEAITKLIEARARFELRHIKNDQYTILDYHFPDYHCLKLENTDLAGDRRPELSEVVNQNWFGFIHYLVFHDQKIIISYNKSSREEIPLIVYKLTEDNALKTLWVG